MQRKHVHVASWLTARAPDHDFLVYSLPVIIALAIAAVAILAMVLFALAHQPLIAVGLAPVLLGIAAIVRAIGGGGDSGQPGSG